MIHAVLRMYFTQSNCLSGVQHLEFDFNKFTERSDLLGVLDVLRHVSGITRVGGALEFAMSVMSPEKVTKS